MGKYPLRVLYIHQHFVTPRGSGGTRSYELSQRLLARGHCVTMVSGSYAGSGMGDEVEGKGRTRRGWVDGIEVVELGLPYSNYDGFGKRAFTFISYALASVGIALLRGYDIIFATSTPLTAGISGIAARCLRHKPFVFEVRDLWPELPEAMGVIRNPLILIALKLLEQLSYNSADAGVGLSPGIVRKIREKTRGRKVIRMIPNACDLELFRPAEENTVEEAVEGVGPEDFLAVFTGTHGIANGLEAVLDAAAVLKVRKKRAIKILFIGDGRRKPGLQARAVREDLDNCLFLDWVPKRRLAGVVRRADVGLMVLANVPAFYYGTSPNKFFDFISAGLPVLNNYPGWLADLIAEHRCGIAVAPDNPRAFADALEYLAEHPEERREMGRNARRLAEEKFSRETMAERFVDLLEMVYRAHQRGDQLTL